LTIGESDAAVAVREFKNENDRGNASSPALSGSVESLKIGVFFGGFFVTSGMYRGGMTETIGAPPRPSRSSMTRATTRVLRLIKAISKKASAPTAAMPAPMLTPAVMAVLSDLLSVARAATVETETEGDADDVREGEAGRAFGTVEAEGAILEALAPCDMDGEGDGLAPTQVVPTQMNGGMLPSPSQLRTSFSGLSQSGSRIPQLQ